MAQQRGSTARLVIDTETTFKSTPGSTDGIYLPFVSESVRAGQNLNESRTIRSSRNPQAPSAGRIEVSGDINLEWAWQYGRILKHVFGSVQTSGSSPPYTHTFKIGDLPAGMCIEKQFPDISGTNKYALFNGCKINRFSLSCGPDGMIDAVVSILGAKETLGSASFESTPRDLGHDAFDAFKASISEGGTALGIATKAEIVIENGLDGDTFVIDGTGQRYSLPEGQAKVTGTLTALFESYALYEKALNGTESSLAIEMTRGSGNGTAGNEKCTFYIDELRYRRQGPIITGPKGLLVELPFVGYLGDDADASALRCIVLCAEPGSTYL